MGETDKYKIKFTISVHRKMQKKKYNDKSQTWS